MQIAPPAATDAERSARLDAVFRPNHVAFIGGRGLQSALEFHRELGFAGRTTVIHPKYETLAGYPCVPSIEALDAAPDLAFIAIRREAAIAAVGALRRRGCRAVICNAAGFAETGSEGAQFERDLIAAAGDMALIGPNTIGVVNYLDPMAAIMDHFGVARPERGVAMVSQGGGVICDAVFCDRGLALTHLAGAGNQATLGVDAFLDYLLDDPRVTAVGLSFEGLPAVDGLRRAAMKALRLGKPIVAFKLGRTAEGARASASHTASMTGAGAAWDALFDRLGIISVASESEFVETLKLFASGQAPKGRRVLAAAASGVLGVMTADCLSAAGFELPQPSPACAEALRALLPGIATPNNPQDITMAAWNDQERQTAIYRTLLQEGFDAAIMVQNYPREGMWDIAEYAAQVEALAAACRDSPVAALQVAPMVDCFPEQARAHTQSLGVAAMQGLEECAAALGHAVDWSQRREALASEPNFDAPAGGSVASRSAVRWDEAAAKAALRDMGVRTPEGCATTPDGAAAAAEALGYPVALKALDAGLLHKTEVGAVRLGLRSAAEVEAAVAGMRADMAERAPDRALQRVLVERMVDDVVAEVMASVTIDPSIGPVMMIAGGGVEAELWNDSTLIAAPFSRAEIARGLDRLKTAQRLAGWRGRPAGDRAALLDLLQALGRFAQERGAVEVEINPILVGRTGAVAVDAVLQAPAPSVAPAAEPAAV